MTEPGSPSTWVGYSEGRRRGAILRFVALFVASLGLFFRASHGASLSDAASLLIVAGSCGLGTLAVIGFAVRPRRTADGTAFLVLTPIGSLAADTVTVTNPNATLPGRLVVSNGAITWTSRRGGRLTWQRASVDSASVRRVPSVRPLGYLSLNLSTGHSFTARVFQPAEIVTALRACGYDVGP